MYVVKKNMDRAIFPFGSVNIPNDYQARASGITKKEIDFHHCLTGSRSGQALSFLKRSGYTKVENIGGITGYQGEVVR